VLTQKLSNALLIAAVAPIRELKVAGRKYEIAAAGIHVLAGVSVL
jgi:hypothetical protein